MGRGGAWRVASLPPAGQVRTRDRAWVTAEILAAYVPLSRVLRRNDLAAMVAAARAPRARRPAPPPAERHAQARRLGSLVDQVLRRLPTDDRCLIQSLVLLRVLEHRSIPATLVIGVRSEGGFEAHAWVEHEEQALLPAGDFARLTEL